MTLTLAKSGADAASQIEVSEAAFGREFNEPLVHQVVVAYMAGARQGSKAQKTRAEVAGGGKKPWRQKGTGRARAGTRSSPVWVGGGRAFAARPRDFDQKVNRKMYRGALQCIFSELLRQDRLVAVDADAIALAAPKTRLLVAKLAEMNVEDALILAAEVDENLYLAARNLKNVEVLDVAGINPVSLLGRQKVVVTVEALKQIEELLA